MDPISKALWHIESRLGAEMSLDDIAAAAGVSRFYLSRAFSNVLDRPVIAYVRARRLSEAARALAAGAEDILHVALDTGYASHEAFTRAFGDLFGATPESVRAKGTTAGLSLLEPIRMSNPPAVTLDPPRFVDGPSLLLVGITERYKMGANAGIPNQWMRFAPFLGAVPGAVPHLAYGVVHNSDDSGFDYMTAMEVKSFDDAPRDLARLRVAPQRYAVFTHNGHISGIQASCAAIWGGWLPQSGFEPADVPFLERYDQRFDPMSGNGDVELWLGLRA